MSTDPTEVRPFLSSIRLHADACRVALAHWHDLPAPKPRHGIDPLALGAPLLPDVALLHVLEGPDFRYDLIGERFREAVPRVRPGSLAGGGAEEPGLRDGFIFSRMRAAVDGGHPVGACNTYVDGRGYPRMSVSTFFPLGLDGGTASDLLVLAFFDREGAPDEDSRALAERRVAFDDVSAFLDRWAPQASHARMPGIP